MDAKRLKELKAETAEATRKRRKHFKETHGVLGHRFGVWARLLNEDELTTWYLYCEICRKPIVYDAVTDSIGEYPMQCPGPGTSFKIGT